MQKNMSGYRFRKMADKGKSALILQECGSLRTAGIRQRK
ncbi:hypothetical protein DCCM_2599 [Desulfocucumis palustris]|uniref:Uncharacterized protein n=1 Tax=Desulfocucumis palustris TaxID=1898651 RepID=A0A2L2XB29_9FIRM|nr:hypothetical protein DCCM_2599 [Desulfocucumis palustris]